MRIYISTPVASKERTEEDVRARVEVLKGRLRERGLEGVSHLDNGCKGKWCEQIGANVALLLACDGILLDNNRKESRVCKIEEAISKVIVTYKTFYFYHTKEEFEFLNDRYVI